MVRRFHKIRPTLQGEVSDGAIHPRKPNFTHEVTESHQGHLQQKTAKQLTNVWILDESLIANSGGQGSVRWMSCMS